MFYLLEGLDLCPIEVPGAQRLLGLVHPEGQVVRGGHHAVAIHHLPQGQELAVLGLRLAEGEVVVLIRLRRRRERSHCDKNHKILINKLYGRFLERPLRLLCIRSTFVGPEGDLVALIKLMLRAMRQAYKGEAQGQS